MLLPLGIGLLAAVGGVLGYAATRPDDFRVQRDTRIDAPPEKVFALLEDFRRWTEWSPWEELDPALQRTHSGAERGTGAKYAWVGNRKVGEGRMEILESTAPSQVRIRLEFLKPWQASNTTEFTLTPEGGGTHVSWTMTGSNPFMMKVVGVVMNMDRMIGRDFEKGLRKLKDAAER